jgi:hypothetical protein
MSVMLQRGSLKTVLLLLRRGGVNRALACADGLNAVDYALQGGYKVSLTLLYTSSTGTITHAVNFQAVLAQLHILYNFCPNFKAICQRGSHLFTIMCCRTCT